MGCKDLSSIFIVTLVTNAGGLFVNIIAMICIVLNLTVESGIRRIILSLSIANILGTGMLFYDSFKLMCNGSHDRMGFVTTITTMLSLSHVMLLILAEHIIMTCKKERKAGHFNGLILVSWVISLSGGSMDVVTVSYQTKMFFAILVLLVIMFIVMKYASIIHMHIQKEKLRKLYETNFLEESRTKKDHERCQAFWNVNYFSVIVLSFLLCTLPYLVLELLEGIQGKMSHSFVHSIVMIIYSINFYFLAFICIYLKYQEVKSRERRDFQPTSYRYRDTFSSKRVPDNRRPLTAHIDV